MTISLKELAHVYAALAAQLSDLLARIEQNDKKVELANNTLPVGSSRFLVAELVARCLPNFLMNQGLTHIPRIVQETRLPAFHYSPSKPFAWRRNANFSGAGPWAP